MPSQATLYLRSSKDRSDVSIDAQRRGLHELAVARGLTVVDEFADAVESGKDEDRPAFQRLIAELKSAGRTWDHILVLDTSRIARRRLISMIFENECQKRGVRLVYKSLPESDPATDMVLRSVLQAFDEYHSLISRSKGLAGMAENVRQGWRAGGRAPRGYKLEHHPTGAVRDGAPVVKSRLVVDDDVAPSVRQYLELRAAGMPRGTAIARLQLPWPPSSTQSMDWQALTYAGHTVWNMHAEREGGAAAGGEKRRARAEWVIQRNTHPALISEEQAEVILRQLEDGVQGRRLRASKLLLTGLLVTPDGQAFHSDGCGSYRLGKGRKISARAVESCVLGAVAADMSSSAFVQEMLQQLERIARGGEPIDGRRISGLEKRAASLSVQIARTVDLAAQMDDPAPVLRRVQDLEHQRARIIEELSDLLAQRTAAAGAAALSEAVVRGLLNRLLDQILVASAEDEARDEARQALREVIERIEVDLKEKSPVLTVHYAINTGDSVASPRGFEPLLQP